MAFPDFMCIGAERAGTSWLYVNLKRHPKIWLPPIKEIRFFSSRRRQTGEYFRRKGVVRRQLLLRFRDYFVSLGKGDLGVLRLRNLLWDVNYFLGKRSMGWYEALFDGHPDQLKGDITPSYGIVGPDTAELIHRCNVDLKIIFIMRDPAERSWSAAMKQFEKRRRFGTIEFQEKELIRLASDPYQLRQNDYLQILANWERHFPPQQIFVGFTEQIEKSPGEFLTGLFEFLDVDFREKYLARDLDRRVNSTQKRKAMMPAAFRYSQAKLYYDSVQKLAQRFEGHPREWLQRYEKILSDPSPDHVGLIGVH